MIPIISLQELSKHASPDDLWVAIRNEVYNLTSFAPTHPAGLELLLKFAGQDATLEYDKHHPPTLIKDTLPISKYIGRLEQPQENQHPLETLLSTHDFVSVCAKYMSPKTYAFVSSAATDLITHRRNTSTYSKISLRPRVLRDVSRVSVSTTMLGHPVSSPIFACPTSLGKTIHTDGEKEIARACKELGIAQVISTSASFSVAEILEAVNSYPIPCSDTGVKGMDGGGGKPHPIFFQLYVDKDASKSEALLRTACAPPPTGHGLSAVFLTVDSPVVGKREADERVPISPNNSELTNPMTHASPQSDNRGASLGRTTSFFLSPSLSWASTIPWLRQILPPSTKIILKGIQTAQDALLASQTAGVSGIVISNHGGRNLDTSPPSILVLLEIRKSCPEVFEKMKVFIDGGITRGTDVFKALCLGAKGVGIGRGILWGLGSGYGKEGVKKYVGILNDELATTMRLCGVRSVDECHPGYLNTKEVDYLVPGRECWKDGLDDGGKEKLEAEYPYVKWRMGGKSKL